PLEDYIDDILGMDSFKFLQAGNPKMVATANQAGMAVHTLVELQRLLGKGVIPQQVVTGRLPFGIATVPYAQTDILILDAIQIQPGGTAPDLVDFTYAITGETPTSPVTVGVYVNADQPGDPTLQPPIGSALLTGDFLQVGEHTIKIHLSRQVMAS